MAAFFRWNDLVKAAVEISGHLHNQPGQAVRDSRVSRRACLGLTDLSPLSAMYFFIRLAASVLVNVAAVEHQNGKFNVG